ncbi:MAG: autotransporter outer membrane beta-barrel domain-containing protein [Cetobacterium sp.]|uniref:autotransporter family protein n=1 Tax=Cetobacterium sp. TaxID=2071632 RepID=UPI002FCBE72A
MNELRKVDGLLKRFLKRKFKITDAVVVGFLITGGIGFAQETVEVSKVETAPSIVEMIKAKFFNHPSWRIEHGSDETIDVDHGHKVLNDGTVSGKFDNGMWATTGGIALNLGVIKNDGDYGMRAGGMDDNDHPGPHVNTQNPPQPPHNQISVVINKGTVENTGDYGIYAENGGIGINHGGKQMVTQQELSSTFEPLGPLASDSTMDLNYGVFNGGDYGMAAVASSVKPPHPATLEANGNGGPQHRPKPYAAILNTGIVANDGDYGMAAIATGDANPDCSLVGVTGPGPEPHKPAMAFAVNTGGKNSITHTYQQDDRDHGGRWPGGRPDNDRYNEDTLTTDNGVLNGGNYGMLASATDHSIAGALNMGLIANGGDYGMAALADGENSLAVVVNTGGTGEFTSELNKYVYEYKDEDGPGPHTGNGGNNDHELVLKEIVLEDKLEVSTENGVLNKGNYGMLAQAKNGGTAIAVNTPMFGLENIGDEDWRNDGDRDHDDNCPDVDIPESVPSMGLVANGGDYGMAAVADGEGSLAVAVNGGANASYDYTLRNEGHMGPRRPHPTFGYEELSGSGTATGGVQNGGDYGMAAVATDGAVAAAINLGLVANGGNIGMIADGADAWAVNLGGTLNASGDLYDVDVKEVHSGPYGGPRPQKKYQITQELIGTGNLEIDGGVKNAGDYGMVALNGGTALNFGLVANGGNVGMLADGASGEDNSYALNTGRDLSLDLKLEAEVVKTKEHNNANPVDNFGNPPNHGDHDVTIIGPDGKPVNVGDRFTVADLTIDTVGGVRNTGDLGMVAQNGGIAVNTGLVANGGEVGMLGQLGGTAINHVSILEGVLAMHDNVLPGEIGIGPLPDFDLDFDELSENVSQGPSHPQPGPCIGLDGKLTFDITMGETGVRNGGNYGMVAQNSGLAINAGLVRNGGDFGMVAYDNSVAINYGRDLTGANLMDMIKSGENMPPLADGILKFITYLHPDLKGFITDTSGKTFAEWAAGDAELTALAQKVVSTGGILNEGNIGAWVLGDSRFINHGVINPDSSVPLSEAGKNAIAANGLDPNTAGKIAIMAGAGDNTIFLGSGSEITGRVNGGGGTNTLYFIESTDAHTGETLNNRNYGTIDDYSFSHILFGKNGGTVNIDGATVDKAQGMDLPETVMNNENVWTIANNIKLTHQQHKTVTDYSVNANGVLTTDKFNSIYSENSEIAREDVEGNFKGNVQIDGGANILMQVGRNLTSTFAANSINMKNGSVTQRAKDDTFVTNANRIEITNIFTNKYQDSVAKTEAQGSGGLLIDGVHAGNGTQDEGKFNVQDTTGAGWTDANGWKATHQYNQETGDVTLVFERTGGNGLQGGYKDTIDQYTQSDVDIINGMNIVNQGYNYARKAAFMDPRIEKSEVIEYPAQPMDKGMKSSGKDKEIIPVPIVEEVIEETPYMNLQFAEVFGDFGKYDGSTTSGYDYDTWGITGATYHRFDDNWLAGISYGYAKSDVDYDTHASNEDVDTVGITGFVSYVKDSWLVTGQLGYSWNDHDLTRNIFDRDINTQVGTNASFDSHMITLGAEVGYNYVYENDLNVYPYVGLDYMWYTRDSYKEGGDQNFALDVSKSDLNTFVSKLGVMLDKSWDQYGMFLDLGWRHYFDDPSSTTASFSTASYDIAGLDIGKDVGYVKVGATYDVTPQMDVGIDYTGSFRDGEIGNRVGLNLSYKW